MNFPMLRLSGLCSEFDDIPDSFPLKRLVIQRHTNDFWHKPPESIAWKGQNIAYQRAAIDTTFGMYRSGTSFSRPSNGIGPMLRLGPSIWIGTSTREI